MQYKFTKSTDEQHQIKVDSNLLYTIWNTGCARGGTEAQFAVRTSLVGQGAQIEITCKGDDYGKINTLKDKIYNNCYKGKIAIPNDIKPGEDIWLEVKLPKQGLKGKSNVIPAMPGPELIKMQWDKTEANRGDIVKIQAEIEQVADQTEAMVIIYEHDQDGNHDKITAIPTIIKKGKIDLQWQYQYPENTNAIPTQEELQQYNKNYNQPQYFFVICFDGVKLGANQESGLLSFIDNLKISLRDENGNPKANTKYILHLPDGSTKQGTLDANGQAVIEKLPPGRIRIEYSDL